jgi:hypothetical protein
MTHNFIGVLEPLVLLKGNRIAQMNRKPRIH